MMTGAVLLVSAGRAVWAQENTEKQTIRVLLMDSDYAGYYHPEVKISMGDETCTYDGESPELAGGSLILPEQEEGICVQSILRQGEYPVYDGTLEIRKGEEGLLLINELPLETYLEAVVPSEMPAAYNTEALKAQAICARTYAWKQKEGQSLLAYGADVDDSVNFQVYRNVSPQESTSQAVRETKGQVLVQGGELIEAYYFSTSAGATSTNQVWGAAEAASYLKSVPCAFDAGSPWGRWEVTIPWETLSEKAASLPGCSKDLNNLAVMKKNESGAAVELCVYTAKGVGIVENEYDIRAFLAPRGCVVTGQDGARTEGGSLLPSAYLELFPTPGKELRITGKGYGHGVGMSQEAANAMAEEGYSCYEILDYFFKDVEVKGAVLP